MLKINKLINDVKKIIFLSNEFISQFSEKCYQISPSMLIVILLSFVGRGNVKSILELAREKGMIERLSLSHYPST